MNRSNCEKLRWTLVGIVASIVLGGGSANADFTFGAPVHLGPPINSPYGEGVTCITADDLEMYVSTFSKPGGLGDWDIWVLRRETVNDDWGEPENLGLPTNTAGSESNAHLSPDGLEMYFTASSRPGGYGDYDIWVTRRTTRNDPWAQPENLGAIVNTAGYEHCPRISADGLELYFCSDRSGGYGAEDIWVAKRATRSDPWAEAVNLGPPVNSSASEDFPLLSSDGLLLSISGAGWRQTAPRPGGYGRSDIWLARRASVSDPWGTPVNLGPIMNTSSHDGAGAFSPDGHSLFLGSDRPGGLGGVYGDIYQAPILPIVDFNGDGKVDAAEMTVLVANWGQNQPLCDIGPFPWGDGMVDEKDLGVLVESAVSPVPCASDVPWDVVLKWISAPVTGSDVYLGTSFEAVDSASRANPQGVLVSQGQTATAYDPAGLLEFGRTHYWRVDFVIPGPTPTVYKGPVLEFTTEAFGRPIENLTAKASSAQHGMGPEKTVDGSGLDKSDGHSTSGNDMWLSNVAGPQPAWIQYEFDKVYALHELWVWNSNGLVEPFIGFGAKSVRIEYSPDGTTWMPLANVPEFARAPGKPGSTANTLVRLGGVSAQFVRLTIEQGWGATPATGLSEVRFFYIPDRPAAKP
jgi:hypothetical protein